MRSPRRAGRWSFLCVACLSLVGAGPLWAQGLAESAGHFRVDPWWPQALAELPAGAVPGVAVDKADQVYVLTRAEPPVRVYTPEGKFVRSWGKGQVGKAHGLRIDHEGNVWVADIGHHVVNKFSSDGQLLLTLGTKGQTGTDGAHFNQPTDIAIAPDGDLFVTDGYGNHRVVHFDKSGRFLGSWGRADTRPGTQPGEFHTPHAIVIDSQGRLYVADRGNARIQVFDRSGTFLDAWTDLMVPWGLWITSRDEVWACGSTPMARNLLDVAYGTPPKDQLFVRFDTTGRVKQLWGVPKPAEGAHYPGTCDWVHGVAIDSKGNLYVGEIKGQRAQKFTRKP